MEMPEKEPLGNQKVAILLLGELMPPLFSHKTSYPIKGILDK